MKLFKTNAEMNPKTQVEKAQKGILIVDDSKFSRRILRDILEEEGYNVVGEASDGLEAVDQAREVRPDCIFMDVAMPKLDGLGAVARIMEFDPNVCVIMCTAMGQKSIIVEAVKVGAKDYVLKPYKKEGIINVLKMHYKKDEENRVIPFKAKQKEDIAREDTNQASLKEAPIREENEKPESIVIPDLENHEEPVVEYDYSNQVQDVEEKSEELVRIEDVADFEEEESLAPVAIDLPSLEEAKDQVEDQVEDLSSVDDLSIITLEDEIIEDEKTEEDRMILGAEKEAEEELNSTDELNESEESEKEAEQVITTEEDVKSDKSENTSNEDNKDMEHEVEDDILKSLEEVETSLSTEVEEILESQEISKSNVDLNANKVDQVAEEIQEKMSEEEPVDDLIQFDYEFLWSNRFYQYNNSQVHKSFTSTISFLDSVKMANDGYGIYEEETLDRDILLGMIQAYLSMNNRLQTEYEDKGFEANENLVRVSTDKILKKKRKISDITMIDLLGRKAEESQQHTKFNRELNGFSKAMKQLVEEKANRNIHNIHK